jgi:hypothetical protein
MKAKWLLTFMIWIPTLLLAPPYHKPALRVLISCDLVSSNIRRGSIADIARIKTSIANIARQLKIHRHITVLSQKKFHARHVLRWLSAIPPHSNDIILFYFSGHGGRLKKAQTQWPFMVFPAHTYGKAKALMGETIYRNLVKKNPRLSLIIFDACNNTVQIKGLEAQGTEPCPIIEKTPILPGLSTLFLKTSGLIIASASSPGEAAFTTVRGKILGGVFTTGWLFSLKHFAQNPHTGWNEVFSGAAAYCAKYYPGRQNPQYIIETTPISSNF